MLTEPSDELQCEQCGEDTETLFKFYDREYDWMEVCERCKHRLENPDLADDQVEGWNRRNNR